MIVWDLTLGLDHMPIKGTVTLTLCTCAELSKPGASNQIALLGN